MAIGCLFFKYRNIDRYSLTSLASGEVWYASKSQLNDPFDCDPVLEWDICDEQVDEILRSHGIRLNKNISEEEKADLLKTSLYQFLDKAGVFCVCPSPYNELMWSHYGDSHQGVAIGYSVQKENICNYSTPHKSPLPVRYNGRGRAKLSDYYKSKLKKPGSEKAFSELVQALYFSKNPAWQYENESRFLSVRKSGLLEVGAAVEIVVFGARTTNEDIFLVNRLLEHSVDQYKIRLRDNGLACERINV